MLSECCIILATGQPGIAMKHEDMTLEKRCIAMKRVMGFELAMHEDPACI